MPNGVGVCTLPIVVINGADVLSGSYAIPMLVIAGVGGATSDGFQLPLPVILGTSGLISSQYTLISLPVPILSSHGYSGVLGRSGLIELPIPVISGGYGYRGSGTFVLPTPEIFTITPLHGVGSVTLPLIVFNGYATQVSISNVYRGIVANLSNRFISTYSNFPFNSLAHFQGHYIGASEQGLFVLGGSKDNTTNILAKIKSGAMDFGDQFIKYLRDAWITYRSDGHLELTVFVDENEALTSVGQTEVASNEIHEEKVKVGRGLKGRFYTIELKNISGADFDIQQVGLLVEAIRRKAR